MLAWPPITPWFTVCVCVCVSESDRWWNYLCVSTNWHSDVSLSPSPLHQSAVWNNTSLHILRLGCIIECLPPRSRKTSRADEGSPEISSGRRWLTAGGRDAGELLSEYLVNIWNGLRGGAVWWRGLDVTRAPPLWFNEPGRVERLHLIVCLPARAIGPLSGPRSITESNGPFATVKVHTNLQEPGARRKKSRSQRCIINSI